MSKFLKISIILFIILLFISSFSYATDINMNLTVPETNSEDSNVTANEVDDQNLISTPNDPLSGSMSPTDVSSISEENMSFSNILNILIITVGVIIILLAIAILIRLKG